MHYLSALARVSPSDARQAILEALRSTGGRREAAAGELGLAPRTLYRLIDQLQLWRAVQDQDRVLGVDDRPRPRRTATPRRASPRHDS